MRLGSMLYRPADVEELEACVDDLDVYGLSTVAAPREIVGMTEGEIHAFGSRARDLGLVVSDAIHKPNLMHRSPEVRDHRIELLRTALVKADAMQAHSVITLVGTVAPEDHLAAPHPYMFTHECAKEFREIVLRAMDGLDLEHTRLAIEPWTTSFFYRPARIRAFLDEVDHPRVGVHLDLVNMVGQHNYYSTSELIVEAFELLRDRIFGVHFKDVLWDWRHMLLKFDEVPIGRGVIDYRLFLENVARLHTDMPCFCEHLETEEQYATGIARLHHIAAQIGAPFVGRRSA